MEAIGIIGIIILIIIGFICLGLLGWVLKACGAIFEFLFDGCCNSIGCLIWVIIILAIICVCI